MRQFVEKDLAEIEEQLHEAGIDPEDFRRNMVAIERSTPAISEKIITAGEIVQAPKVVKAKLKKEEEDEDETSRQLNFNKQAGGHGGNKRI